MFPEIGSRRSSSLDRCELYQTSSPVLLFTSSEPVRPGMIMTGAFPVDGATDAVVAGAVVCAKAATPLNKTQNIIIRNLTLDSFIRCLMRRLDYLLQTKT